MNLEDKSTQKIAGVLQRVKLLLPPDQYQAWLQQVKAQIDAELASP